MRPMNSHRNANPIDDTFASRNHYTDRLFMLLARLRRIHLNHDRSDAGTED